MLQAQYALSAMFVAAAVLLAAPSFAQTTSPGRAPPQQTVPPQQTTPAPQVRVPQAAAIRPNAALTQTIPVYIVGINVPDFGDGDVRSAQRFAERDHDNDGHASIDHGGPDCDDGNAAVSPARTEIADAAGQDEDCDYATVGARDQDRDGFVSWQAINIVRDTAGNAIGVVRGPDCDDSHRDTNPNAVEVVGDLRDNDCDGWIDRVVSTGHGEYCAPIAQTTPANALGPCGRPQGDTSQWQRR